LLYFNTSSTVSAKTSSRSTHKIFSIRFFNIKNNPITLKIPIIFARRKPCL